MIVILTVTDSLEQMLLLDASGWKLVDFSPSAKLQKHQDVLEGSAVKHKSRDGQTQVQRWSNMSPEMVKHKSRDGQT